ncbi:MAG: DUF1592 domain-containing protein [Candidatus Hydrogenedentes bacterium]|nr:DUF1592 domain-containing protein [Candidatus Hydrogenedentota bacterium]
MLRLTHRYRVALLSAALSVAAGADEAFEAEILPLVKMYCAECHNNDTARGDLNLARFETFDMVIDSLALWQRAVLRIENKEMPPRKNPVQPTDEERKKLIEWVRAQKDENVDCNRLANEESTSWYPGYVMSRRLNRYEYENSLRDLLGITLDVAEMFPSDGAGGEGFDNNGSALFLSSIQIEKYLEAADLAVETALPDKPRLRRASTDAPQYALASENGNDAQRSALIPFVPGRGTKARDAARQVLTGFIERAWRRPVTASEVEHLLQAFDRGDERGDSYEDSVKLAFKAALISPYFLFLAEPEPAEMGNYALGDFPLASRMSYFIWSSMPDDELSALAREGKLQDLQVLQQQVKRMLRDPKSRALGDQFATQWLGITQLGVTTKPDAGRFPEFNDTLAESMRGEAAAFFHYLVSEDRSLIELLDARYTFANEQLASIYGIDGVTGPELRRVDLADANRGGVLGMAAVLTSTSQPLRTSPVLRGKWVLEQLLGDRVPPPPPEAGVLPEDDVQPDGLTLRARLEEHRKNPDCASCHQKMDPLGFGLENFDPVGRWRDEQAGQPIDSKGVLPSGEEFTGPQALKAILLKQKDAFARHLSRKMVGYALGRSLTRYDDCVIDNCVTSLTAAEYRPSALVTEIVLSYPFRHRYSGGEDIGTGES